MPTSDDILKQQPKILIPEVKIQSRISELAHDINHDYHGQTITAICILKGTFIFFSDLIRKLDLPVTCEFLGVSSYGNKMVSSGEVKMTLDVHDTLEGRNVLVVEDIVDTGLTLSYIMNVLKMRKPATIKSCALLMKPDCLKTDVHVDYLGFKIENQFVVGYGVDYAGKFRGLPYIGYIEHGH